MTVTSLEQQNEVFTIYITYLVGGDWNINVICSIYIYIYIYMGIVIPSDSYFSEGLKPPTSIYIYIDSIYICHGCQNSQAKYGSISMSMFAACD